MSIPTAFVITHESDPNRKTMGMSIIALTIARALGRKDVRVVRIHPNHLDYSLKSKYWSNIEICPNFYESEEDLLIFLLGLEKKYDSPRVLIPASDDCAYFVAKYQDKLNRVFEIPVPQKNVMEKLTNKKSQYEVAQSLGLPIPETYFPTSMDDVKKLVQKINNYPYVIKPTIAHKWRLAANKNISQGKKGHTVNNTAELINKCAEIGIDDQEIMVQEIIGGRDERLFTFLSYFNKNAEPLAYCIRSKIRQCPIDFGYCTLTESCYDDTVKNQSIKLLKSIGYHGISGIEWKLDPKTEQYKLIEINPRAVNTTGAAIACGVNLPYIAYLDKIKQNVEPVTQWKEGIKWIWFLQDIWAARELNNNGALTFPEWWKSLKGEKVHAIFAIDDLRPFIGYFLKFIRGFIQAIWKKLLA